MPSPFAIDDSPQQPRQLTSPAEIVANLSTLMDSHDPLIVRFNGRNRKFQSFVVAIDKANNRVALDELMPNDGDKLMQAREAFSVEAFHDGVRITWSNEADLAVYAQHEGAPCFWLPLPSSITYHQRRAAFRVSLKQTQKIPLRVSDSLKAVQATGLLVDISATGCRCLFKGNLQSQLLPGAVLDHLTIALDQQRVTCHAEVRHVHFDEKRNLSLVGIRFYKLQGLEQRTIERFVYQQQRESRRTEND
ncbi:flagellar brake protein [Atopomonas sediminilitoris]|uniref:flagellar brake protein n=1 Tax=Atopomonas sediminilitoris TaxID=2919919 RepID=UPI001F4E499B|nr:flagellar brake protein [Atopomonas sediminilitoris]